MIEPVAATSDTPIVVPYAGAIEITPAAVFIEAVGNIAEAVERYSIINVSYNKNLNLDSPGMPVQIDVVVSRVSWGEIRTHLYINERNK